MASVEVGVYLGGEYALVAEQFLHLTYARTALKQMRGEGVAEGVGAHLLVDARTLGGLLDDGENHYAGESLASVVEEEYVAGALYLAAFLLVELYAVACQAADGHQTLLVALADDAYMPFAKEQVAHT